MPLPRAKSSRGYMPISKEPRALHDLAEADDEDSDADVETGLSGPEVRFKAAGLNPGLTMYEKSQKAEEDAEDVPKKKVKLINGLTEAERDELIVQQLQCGIISFVACAIFVSFYILFGPKLF